jgi:hypothetical protein
LRNQALEAPSQDPSNFIERIVKTIVGFRGGAQIEKSSLGGSKAGPEQLHKEKC